MTGDLFLGLSETAWVGISVFVGLAGAIGSFGILILGISTFRQSEKQIAEAERQFEAQKALTERGLSLAEHQHQQLLSKFQQDNRAELFNNTATFKRVGVVYKHNPLVKGVVEIQKRPEQPTRYRNFKPHVVDDESEKMSLTHKNGNDDFRSKADAVKHMEQIYDITDYALE